jgi:uncharacterized protein (TIGR02594 family)
VIESLTQKSPLPPHLLWALTQLGEKEIAGGKDNPAIVAYHATTASGAAPDEVPWCSSFVNAAWESRGVRGSRSKAAVSWVTWGVESKLRTGAVVHFGKAAPDAKGTGHVALVFAWDAEWVYVIGGNQGNAVTVAKRPRASVGSCRWPAGVP